MTFTCYFSQKSSPSIIQLIAFIVLLTIISSAAGLFAFASNWNGGHLSPFYFGGMKVNSICYFAWTHRDGGVKSTNGLGHATEIYLGVKANICSWSASRRESTIY